MNRQLLNQVQFDHKKIKLSKNEQNSNRDKNTSDMGIRLSRLAFFIFIIGAMIFGGLYAIRCTVSFTRGENHIMSWGEINGAWQEQHR